MFMSDRHGTFAPAVRSRSSRTPLAPYCGSCMASTTRSWAAGSAASGAAADTLPGRVLESISTGPRPLSGRRTRVPSRLISSAVAGRHTSFAWWPAAASFVASSEP